MQDKYVGDIGDYGKLGLLRRLQNAGLTIGVNWYLTPDETHKGDGRFTHYQQYQNCDKALYCALQEIIAKDSRKVSSLKTDSILHAVFFPESLKYTSKAKAKRISFRQEWHKRALRYLDGLDIVFVDPDNGLLVPSAKETCRDNKYVTPEELEGYYRQGATVIYYQHKARRKDPYYMDQHTKLMHSGCFPGVTGLGLKFRPVSQRYYFFLIQPEHYAMVRAVVDEMLASPWGQGVTPAFSELKQV